jgi:hypothetical protein
MNHSLPNVCINPDFKLRSSQGSPRIGGLLRNGYPPSVARLSLVYTSPRSADRHYPLGRPGVESEGLPSGGFSLFRLGTVATGSDPGCLTKVP